MHKISVAIITHNRVNLLHDCLNSLEKQTWRPDDIVIVDNASTDATQDVVRQHTSTLPIRYFFSSRTGYSINRLIALRKTKFNTVAWIDDDCIALPNWIEEIQKSLEIGLYLFQGVDVDKKTNIISYTHNLRTQEFRLFSKKLLRHRVTLTKSRAYQLYGSNRSVSFPIINSIDHRCFIYRKEILKALPIWFNDKLPSYFSADEWDILRRVRNAGYYVLLNPRIKVIHQGRSTIGSYITRQYQYGKNDAIREWLDKKRRLKIARISLHITEPEIKKFFRTNTLFFWIDIQLLTQVFRERFTFSQKTLIALLFLSGKCIRSIGKWVEKLTNFSLRT